MPETSTPRPTQPNMPQSKSQLSKRYNILCQCHHCGREWLDTDYVVCSCGSSNVEHTPTWQLNC